MLTYIENVMKFCVFYCLKKKQWQATFSESSRKNFPLGIWDASAGLSTCICTGKLHSAREPPQGMVPNTVTLHNLAWFAMGHFQASQFFCRQPGPAILFWKMRSSWCEMFPVLGLVLESWFWALSIYSCRYSSLGITGHLV